VRDPHHDHRPDRPVDSPVPRAGAGAFDASDDDASVDPAPDGAARDADLADDDEEAWLDDEFPLGDGVADTEAEVRCPYCGEPNAVALDPGGGAQQEYVEDCQVCCQPWRVMVVYQEDGTADVWADCADGR
jgi:hypothetical protein